MIVRQQRLNRLLVQHRGHEPSGNVTLDQALAILGEHRRVPHRLIQRQPDKAAEQQIVVEGEIEGRPNLAYSTWNSADNAASASFTIRRIGRNGYPLELAPRSSHS
jgi:hypothetical protein